MVLRSIGVLFPGPRFGVVFQTGTAVWNRRAEAVLAEQFQALVRDVLCTLHWSLLCFSSSITSCFIVLKSMPCGEAPQSSHNPSAGLLLSAHTCHLYPSAPCTREVGTKKWFWCLDVRRAADITSVFQLFSCLYLPIINSFQSSVWLLPG